MDFISSRNNPKIKGVRALQQRKARQEARQFIVEGIRHVGEAVEANATIDVIFYAPEHLDSQFASSLISSQTARGVPCHAVTRDVFDSMASKENPQGILAVLHQPDTGLDELNPQNFDWGVALVAPQDPGNLGAILRTIDAVGASGMLLLESGVDPYHPSAVRASMGTMFWHPVISASFIDFVRWAKKHAYFIYGTSAHAALDYRQVVSYRKPRILLLGSERQGLLPEQAEVCEQLVGLPMHGRATSLNLAVAAGVMLYAMLERS